MHPLITHITRSLQGVYPPEEAKALALMICCDILGIRKLDLYTGQPISLSDGQQLQLSDILTRLQANEPIQYICGFADFCGREFGVGPGVLVPRPETAELARLIVSENSASSDRILDIGTGSGCIAITLYLELPGAEVDAWDVSPEALEVARANNRKLGANVRFQLCDVLDEATMATAQPGYRLIVSNPPYIVEKERATMAPNVLEWEPAGALFVPDADPLLFYRRIARLGRTLLEPGGRLYFEINQAYGLQTTQLLEAEGYRHIRLLKDLYDNDRFAVATL
ncbi:MAG: peptide chain release factor N(5)-glutamine methyltransferase [Mediterranea sp.]|jgi:release factor glutamine methyltransferase|nr:peptide chain release factor N(5)-glutamine methyltransferase [Mediterranea sp.]